MARKEPLRTVLSTTRSGPSPTPPHTLRDASQEPELPPYNKRLQDYKDCRITGGWAPWRKFYWDLMISLRLSLALIENAIAILTPSPASSLASQPSSSYFPECLVVSIVFVYTQLPSFPALCCWMNCFMPRTRRYWASILSSKARTSVRASCSVSLNPLSKRRRCCASKSSAISATSVRVWLHLSLSLFSTSPHIWESWNSSDSAISLRFSFSIMPTIVVVSWIPGHVMWLMWLTVTWVRPDSY